MTNIQQVPRKKILRYLLTVAIILFIISTLSNIISYDFFSPDYSRPWREWHPDIFIGKLKINAVFGDISIETIRSFFL